MHSIFTRAIVGGILLLSIVIGTPVTAEVLPSAAIITEQLTPITGDEEAADNQLPSIDLAVEFEINSARLTERARALLNILGEALSHPRFSKTVFGIYGHSDASGRSEYNLQLSEKRAHSVAEYLVNSLGIKVERLRTRGLGETQLKYPNEPYSKANRRVEIINLSANESSPPLPLQPDEAQHPDSSHQSITD
jgi:outer membrane protein OmpA-like peptidoglycan-associated protein